ncbi:MAG: hypothetical protein ACRDUV_02710 [Pseudonocardiaceae bacterium]
MLIDRARRALPDDEERALVYRSSRSAERAPSRPHPYSPHTGLAGSASHRFWSVVDRFWDSAEGRAIPYPPPRRSLHHHTLLTSYILGTPVFDEPPA